MFITRDFVFVHFPKTGGTFVEAMLRRLHPIRSRRVVWRAARRLGLPVTAYPPHHGTWRDVHQPLRQRELLTCVRHPLDRYVSQYRFARHLQHPEHFGAANPRIAARWPDLSALSFEQFVRFMNDANTFLHFPGFDDDDQPGHCTQQFLFFVAPNLVATVRDLTPESARNGHLRDMLPAMHALFTHDLNRGLYDYLLSRGYAEHRVRFILDAGRVLPEGGGRPRDDHWSRYYTPRLEAYVRRKERLLFEFFPQFEEAEREASVGSHRRAA